MSHGNEIFQSLAGTILLLMSIFVFAQALIVYQIGFLSAIVLLIFLNYIHTWFITLIAVQRIEADKLQISQSSFRFDFKIQEQEREQQQQQQHQQQQQQQQAENETREQQQQQQQPQQQPDTVEIDSLPRLFQNLT